MSEITKEFNDLKNTMYTYIESITGLIRESESLQKVISETNDDELRERLQKVRQSILHSIDKLVVITEDLFKSAVRLQWI